MEQAVFGVGAGPLWAVSGVRPEHVVVDADVVASHFLDGLGVLAEGHGVDAAVQLGKDNAEFHKQSVS